MKTKKTLYIGHCDKCDKGSYFIREANENKCLDCGESMYDDSTIKPAIYQDINKEGTNTDKKMYGDAVISEWFSDMYSIETVFYLLMSVYRKYQLQPFFYPDDYRVISPESEKWKFYVRAVDGNFICFKEGGVAVDINFSSSMQGTDEEEKKRQIDLLMGYFISEAADCNGSEIGDVLVTLSKLAGKSKERIEKIAEHFRSAGYGFHGSFSTTMPSGPYTTAPRPVSYPGYVTTAASITPKFYTATTASTGGITK